MPVFVDGALEKTCGGFGLIRHLDCVGHCAAGAAPRGLEV
jgi:hypothetical protein